MKNNSVLTAPYASWKPSFRLTANFRFTTPRFFPSTDLHPRYLLSSSLLFFFKSRIQFRSMAPPWQSSKQKKKNTFFLSGSRGWKEKFDSRIAHTERWLPFPWNSPPSRIGGSRRGIRLEPVLVRSKGEYGWIVWILNGGNPGHGDTCACSLINPRLRGGILGGWLW